MPYKNILLLIVFLIVSNCTTGNLVNNKPVKTLNKGFTNKGFALIYSEKQ